MVRLSSDLKDELFALAILTSSAVVNFRAETIEMAAVSVEIPKNVAKEAQRLGLSKSMWTRLLPPGKAWLRSKMRLSPSEELPGDFDECDLRPFWEQLAREQSM